MRLLSQVADARNLPRQLAAAPAVTDDVNGGNSGANEAQQQIAYSDVVLLNKVRRLLHCPLPIIEAPQPPAAHQIDPDIYLQSDIKQIAAGSGACSKHSCMLADRST